MKRVSTLEYLQKKNIIEDFENGKYTSTMIISDEEFNRINNKLEEYYSFVSKFSFASENQSQFEQKLTQLENDVNALKEVAYDEVIINNGTMDVSNIQ